MRALTRDFSGFVNNSTSYRDKLQGLMQDALMETDVNPKSGSVGCVADIVLPSGGLARSFGRRWREEGTGRERQ